jgi:hypothetical protein
MTVETLFLRRYYVLFFIEYTSRRVWFAGCTTNRDGNWVTQQARNLSFTGLLQRTLFLIRDRDRKYAGPFDECSDRGHPDREEAVRSPQDNAIAERFVRTIRTECLDWLLILNRRHLEHVLSVYTYHYYTQRPHRALKLEPPGPANPPPGRQPAKSGAETDSAVSSTSTTEPPHEGRHG